MPDVLALRHARCQPEQSKWPFETPEWEFRMSVSRRSLILSSRRNPAAWAWVWRYLERSSRPTGGASGPNAPPRAPERRFDLLSVVQRTPAAGRPLSQLVARTPAMEIFECHLRENRRIDVHDGFGEGKSDGVPGIDVPIRFGAEREIFLRVVLIHAVDERGAPECIVGVQRRP